MSSSSGFTPMATLVLLLLVGTSNDLRGQATTADSQSNSGQGAASVPRVIVGKNPYGTAGKLYYGTSPARWHQGYGYGYDDPLAKPDSAFLDVLLTVENRDSRPRVIPGFHLVDTEKRLYALTNKVRASANPIIPGEVLNPGVAKHGVLVFDVPKDRIYSLVCSSGDADPELLILRVTR